jgi:hypothetical protein
MNHWLHRLTTLLIPAVLAAFLIACSGDSYADGESPPTSTPSPTSPSTTPETPPRPSPTATAPGPAPSPTPDPGSAYETGIEAVDAVIEAVLARDAAALQSLLRFSEAACTHQFGGGGPPKCFAYQPAPPEGTVVEAFPLSTCEGEWRTELGPIVEMLLDRELALYGAVELNLDGPLFGLEYYPQPEYGVLLQQEFNGEIAGILLGVEDGGWFSYIDFLCFPPPEWIFSEQAEVVYGDSVELILRGPASQ